MRSMKFCYALLCIGSIFFFILYRDLLSLFLMLVAFLVPLVMVALLLVLSRSIDVRLVLDKLAQAKNVPVQCNLMIRNRSFLPLPYAVVKVQYRNSLSSRIQTMVFHLVAPPHDTQILTIPITSAYCGRVFLSVEQIQLFDYLRLFSHKLKLDCKTEVLILPRTWPVILPVSQTGNPECESTLFSKHFGGDDPSEVFSLNNYIPGDKPNRIHWKLSSKLDTLMVKQYSLPIESAAHLLLEWTSEHTPIQLLDAMVECVYAISDFLVSQEAIHNISWYAKQQLTTEVITTDESLSVAIGRLFGTVPPLKAGNTLAELEALPPTAHLLYFTAFLTETQLTALSYCRASRITVLYLINPAAGQPQIVPHKENIEILPVSAHNISGSIQELVI